MAFSYVKSEEGMEYKTATNRKSEEEAKIKAPALEYIFHPRSIAIIGASPNPRNQSNVFIREFRKFGFKGEVYLVNPGYQEVLGMPVYETLSDVPGDVDHVISCVPAALVPALVEQCVEKKVKVLHLYTGRMAEAGLEDRVKMQEDVVAESRAAGIRVIGPNCMGLYYAPEGLTFRMSFPQEMGGVGFMSQSGGNCAELVYKGCGRGLKFSKVVSYGNASDLNECDFLEYFMEDPETEVIAAYIEGVKDGKRFFRLAREAARRKPLIILKGGRTDAGRRAVASHTASLAGVDAIWDAVCHQIGAVRVYSIGELSDMLLAFSFLKPPASNRTAAMGGGGGVGVSAADAYEQEGLELPPLPDEIVESLKKLVPDVWSMFSNPVDFSILGPRPEVFDICKMVASHKQYDLLIGNLGPEWALDEPAGADWIPHSIDMFITASNLSGKPLAVVVPFSDSPEAWRWEAVMKAQEKCVEEGLPVFHSIGSAANAVGKFIAYHRRRKQLSGRY
jgi:acyl-CoA synthetase (NDP forming)